MGWKKDETRGTYDFNQGITTKTSMIRLKVYNYGDAYIHVKRTISISNTGTAAAPNNANKKTILKSYTPFTICISKWNNTQIDNANDIDVVMPVDNLIW